MDVVGSGPEHVLQDLPGGTSVRLLDELSQREPAREVNANKGIDLTLGGLPLGDVNVEEADWVALELTPRLVAVDVMQARDAMPPQARVRG